MPQDEHSEERAGAAEPEHPKLEVPAVAEAPQRVAGLWEGGEPVVVEAAQLVPRPEEAVAGQPAPGVEGGPVDGEHPEERAGRPPRQEDEEEPAHPQASEVSGRLLKVSPASVAPVATHRIDCLCARPARNPACPHPLSLSPVIPAVPSRR